MDYLQYISFGPTGYITAFFVVCAMSFFAYFRSCTLNLRKLNKNKALERIINQIKEAEMPDRTVDNFPRLNEIFAQSDNPILNEEWELYFARLNEEKKLNRVLDPAHFFDADRIIEKYSGWQMAENASSLLTGWGILGTFVGLIIGLYGLDIESMEHLREQIPVLIGGMSTAFWSSAAAIFLSFIYSLLYRRLTGHIQSQSNLLIEELRKVLPVRDESDLLQKIEENQQEQLRATKEFISDSLIPELVTGLKEAVDQSITPQISNMSETVNQLAEVSSQRQAESLEKMVDKFMVAFNEGFENQFESLKNTLEEVIHWQQNTKEEMESLISTIEKNAEIQSGLLEKTGGLLQGMENYVSEFDAFHQELKTNLNSLNNITGNLKNLEEQLNARLQSMLDEYSEIHQNRAEEITRIKEQIKEIQSYWNSVEGKFIEMNERLESAMDHFADRTHDGLERTFDVFDKNLTQISNTLGSTIQELEEMVEELPDSLHLLIDTLSQFDNSQSEILEELAAVEERLEQYTEAKKKGFFSKFGGE